MLQRVVTIVMSAVVVLLALTASSWAAWKLDKTGLPSDTLRGAAAFSPTAGWAVGNNGQVWKKYAYTWTDVSGLPGLPGRNSDYNFTDIFFVPFTNYYGWIVGYKKSDNSGIVRRTTNGGATWDAPITLPNFSMPAPFLKVSFTSNGVTGYITCGNGYVLKSVNYGQTWSFTQSRPTTGFSTWYPGLWSDPSNSNNLWIAGDANGHLAKSTDGGASWFSAVTD